MLDIIQKPNQIQVFVQNCILLQTITHSTIQMRNIIHKLNQIQIIIQKHMLLITID